MRDSFMLDSLRPSQGQLNDADVLRTDRLVHPFWASCSIWSKPSRQEKTLANCCSEKLDEMVRST